MLFYCPDGENQACPGESGLLSLVILTVRATAALLRRQGQTLKDLNNYSLCARTRVGLGKCAPARRWWQTSARQSQDACHPHPLAGTLSLTILCLHPIGTALCGTVGNDAVTLLAWRPCSVPEHLAGHVAPHLLHLPAASSARHAWCSLCHASGARLQHVSTVMMALGHHAEDVRCLQTAMLAHARAGPPRSTRFARCQTWRLPARSCERAGPLARMRRMRARRAAPLRRRPPRLAPRGPTARRRSLAAPRRRPWTLSCTQLQTHAWTLTPTAGRRRISPGTVHPGLHLGAPPCSTWQSAGLQTGMRAARRRPPRSRRRQPCADRHG